MTSQHTFHIPVMGTAFTADSPLKVAHYGINTVIALADDVLLERLRKYYSDLNDIYYDEIKNNTVDYRADRITAYLDVVTKIVSDKFDEFTTSTEDKFEEVKKYFAMLPDSSDVKREFNKLIENSFRFEDLSVWLKDNLSMGSIDVNIMTKVDKDNYVNKEKLPVEYNDAHAALRGFANSNVNSSVILSAGMNPRLYSYLEQFEDFYPDQNGAIKKKVILKVSDYRSALIQGKFLAKKGIWVSEYRIESGLNCGGHAFATEGYLLGPVLEEFKTKRKELQQIIQEVLFKSLINKNNTIPKTEMVFKISAQGGVGTAEEHQFLLDHYGIDSVGWGSPFLLVPEATTVDTETLNKLIEAKEEDVYLSHISPLGVPFNNLKGNTKDLEKKNYIDNGRPGSSCPKKFIALNKEFTEKGICTASRQYQHLKIKELDKQNISTTEYKKEYSKITKKSCICVGLGTASLLINNLSTKTEGVGVSVCPGPNIAYFTRKMSLQEMTKAIYDESTKITCKGRPNMFIKELNIYIEYLKEKLEENTSLLTTKQLKYFKGFGKNLKEGLNYYYTLFSQNYCEKLEELSVILSSLEQSKKDINNLNLIIEKIS